VKTLYRKYRNIYIYIYICIIIVYMYIEMMLKYHVISALEVTSFPRQVEPQIVPQLFKTVVVKQARSPPRVGSGYPVVGRELWSAMVVSVVSIVQEATCEQLQLLRRTLWGWPRPWVLKSLRAEKPLYKSTGGSSFSSNLIFRLENYTFW